MAIKLTTEMFITRAINVHGDRYDYSKVVYINTKTKVCIICPEHGVFWQTPNGHIRGGGCKACAIAFTASIRRMSTDDFIARCINIHGYKYKYIDTIYMNMFKKVVISCPTHGNFTQTPNAHLNGQGCSRCADDRLSKLYTLTLSEFVERAMKTHGTIYDYSEVVYRGYNNNINIICQIHGVFNQTPHNHIGGCGCPICKISHGERETAKWLDEHKVEYIREYSFPSLIGINGGQLRFDFYISDCNTCIEYDGEFHYEELLGQSYGLSYIKEHDKRKNEYCDKHGIRLIRIRYDESIDEVLTKYEFIP